MKAIILAGSAIVPNRQLKALAQKADFVIAADSGLRHAETLGVRPHLIVGDFDSVSPEALARYPELPREVYPSEKDWLDLELALKYARAQGAADIAVIGALGGRFDHSLATVLIAARLCREGVTVTLYSGTATVHFLRAGGTLTMKLPVGQLFSVLSLVPESTISIANAKYPLVDYRLEFGVGLGVSNIVTASPLVLKLKRGLVAVVLEESFKDVERPQDKDQDDRSDDTPDDAGDR